MIEGETYLRVTVEVVPNGDLRKRRELGRARIDCIDGNPHIGSFSICIRRGAAFRGGSKIWKAASVFDVPRATLGPWDILYRLLAVAVGNRNRSVGTDGTNARRQARHHAKRKMQDVQE